MLGHIFWFFSFCLLETKEVSDQKDGDLIHCKPLPLLLLSRLLSPCSEPFQDYVLGLL